MEKELIDFKERSENEPYVDIIYELVASTIKDLYLTRNSSKTEIRFLEAYDFIMDSNNERWILFTGRDPKIVRKFAIKCRDSEEFCQQCRNHFVVTVKRFIQDLASE